MPPQNIRELRDLTRYRQHMVQEATAQKNRIEKYLQQCGFKLSTFITDICGMSGMAIIKQLCEKGEIKPEEVLDLLHGAVRTKIKDIKLAVNGRLSAHQRDFLKMLFDWYETCRAGSILETWKRK